MRQLWVMAPLPVELFSSWRWRINCTRRATQINLELCTQTPFHHRSSKPTCCTNLVHEELAAWRILKSRQKRLEVLNITSKDCKTGVNVVVLVTSGGSKVPRAPRGSKFLQFHSVFGEFWQNRMLAPPLGSSRPLLGEILDPPLVTVVVLVILNLRCKMLDYQVLCPC